MLQLGRSVLERAIKRRRGMDHVEGLGAGGRVQTHRVSSSEPLSSAYVGAAHPRARSLLGGGSSSDDDDIDDGAAGYEFPVRPLRGNQFNLMIA